MADRGLIVEPVSVPADGTPLLQVEGLGKQFKDHVVLDDVSFSVDAGEVIAIIGPSGGGKSTLLRCINFLERPSRGRIVLSGEEIGQCSRRNGQRPAGDRQLAAARREIGMVFQGFNLFPHKTAIENIVLAQVHVLGRSRAVALDRASDLLQRVGLADKAGRYPGRLSGGEQQRVAIARALALDPKLILFDEPTSAIDPEVKVEVLAVMRDLADAGMTMLIATHEMHFAREVADRVLFVADSRITEQGTPAEVLLAPKQERTKRFLHAVLEQ